MKDAKSITTLLEKYFKLTKHLIPNTNNEKEYMTNIIYASMVGSLMHAMVCTRLDIA